jgi:hypothetical protein
MPGIRRTGQPIRGEPEIEPLETFTSAKTPVANPAFPAQRRQALMKLDLSTIDPPIVTLVSRFNELPYCFTLQSCYGHFLPAGQQDRHNLKRLPQVRSAATVGYRIAYLALCIDENDQGIALLADLGDVPSLDPDYVQFGCGDWFWHRQVNSYALQVEPKRYETEDEVCIAYEEALHIQAVRDSVFSALERLLDKRPESRQFT